MFGSRWRVRIPRLPTPTTRAAVTNSASRNDRIWLRTIRATCGQPSSPMTEMTDTRLGPTTDTKMIVISSVGMLSTVSVARIRIMSVAPPK